MPWDLQNDTGDMNRVLNGPMARRVFLFGATNRRCADSKAIRPDDLFQSWALLHDNLQRSPLFCANIVKKDPGRARQNSLATAGQTRSAE